MSLATLRLDEFNGFLICRLIDIPAHDCRSKFCILLRELFTNAMASSSYQHNVIRHIALFNTAYILKHCLKNVVKYFNEQEGDIKDQQNCLVEDVAAKREAKREEIESK